MKPFADERETWVAVAAALDRRQIAYVHTSDQLVMGYEAIPASFAAAFCQAYHGTLISAGGFERDTAERALQDGSLNLVAFGRPFIANPDLVERMEHGWPLAEGDRATFYGLHGARGYTDYPSHVPAQLA
jgi:2,4-dienoyl-CoA reductase-like NADH-dependent reductase (Old Yellow Enzyme family)